MRRLDDGGELGVRCWGRPRLRVERDLDGRRARVHELADGGSRILGTRKLTTRSSWGPLFASGTCPERVSTARQHGSRVR